MRARALHPLALRVGREAGWAPPALAKRIGGGAAAPAQRQGLPLLTYAHGVPGSCTTLRTLLGSLSAGRAPHGPAAQVAQVVRWRHQARASSGRWPPTLAVGRDGVHVPLRHGAWTEGAPATVAVLERRGKRVGTGDRGQLPEAGHTTLPTPWTALIHDILRPVESPGLRLASRNDDGDHPRDASHNGLKKMHAPKRPGRQLAWRRLVASSHAGLDIQPLADALCGPSPKGWAWAPQRRTHLQHTSDGITRVVPSASA